MTEIIAHIKKEFIIEWRKRYALNGILLYVASTLFLLYLAFIQIDVIVWNTLFWVLLLFISVNAMAKSFLMESRHRDLYYFQVSSPVKFIAAKIIYNTLLLMLISLVTLFAYTVLLGNPINNIGQYLLVVLTGTVAFSILFTFVSAIASKTEGNQSTLSAVLGFPLIIPVLLLLVKTSQEVIAQSSTDPISQRLWVLWAIIFILLNLSFILFPYLWHD